MFIKCLIFLIVFKGMCINRKIFFPILLNFMQMLSTEFLENVKENLVREAASFPEVMFYFVQKKTWTKSFHLTRQTLDLFKYFQQVKAARGFYGQNGNGIKAETILMSN